MLQTVAKLRRDLAAVNRRTLNNASISDGALVINSGGSITGGGGSTTANEVVVAAGGTAVADTAANTVMVLDTAGGIADPRIPIMLYEQWNGLSSTAPGPASIIQSSIVTEQTLWVGYINKVSHPALAIYGTWGAVVATGTQTLTFRLYANGAVVPIQTWSRLGSAGMEVNSKHTADIHTLLGLEDVEVHVTVQASITAAVQIAAQARGLYQCKTPAGGVFS